MNAIGNQQMEKLYAANSGIVLVTYVPTIGTIAQQIESSELQNNVRLLWTPVRQSNSGAVNNYDQSDLFQMTLASSSAFEMLRLIARPLNYISAKRKAMNTITAWDKHVLSVMCGGYTNANFIIRNQSDIIQAINSCIRAFNSQALPIGFDLTKRRSLLNGRIFTHDKDRDELYIFTPGVYYVYDEATATLLARKLELSVLFSSIENMTTCISNMLTPLVNGTVTSIMAGDMKKAFPKQVSIIRELPYKFSGDVYSSDEHILEALRNGTIHKLCDIDVSTEDIHTNFDIHQGVNSALDTYIYQGRIDSEHKVYMDYKTEGTNFNDWLYLVKQSAGSIVGTVSPTKVLDVKVDKPERYDIMAGTRFMTTETVTFTEQDSKVNLITQLSQWGSEILTCVEVFVFNDQNAYSENELQEVTALTSNYNGYCLDDLSYIVPMYQRFHYLPQFYNVAVNNSRTGQTNRHFQLCNLAHSVYNVRIMTPSEIGHLHVASFGSLVSIQTNNDSSIE
nr:putative capsid protein [Picobirnavirus sp.]